MPQIVSLAEIKEITGKLDLVAPIAAGFVAYSRGEVVVPPVGELVFEDPPGDTHIKYGYIKNRDTYVIKIASGFYRNPELGLSSSSGLMMVFSQKTGLLKTILLDDGYLTNVRTAIAGQIAATYLAPSDLAAIGVLGSGIQARMQVAYLRSVTTCRKVLVWGRSDAGVERYKRDMEADGFEVFPQKSPADVARQSQLIVTTTPSSTPLLKQEDISAGTHITAMGSDTPGKQELAATILTRADYVIADSIEQCRGRGEISKALGADGLKEESILELGQVIENPDLVTLTGSSISVVDLTGVAVQDVQIASAVCEALE